MIRFEVSVKTVSELNTRGHWGRRARRASSQRAAVLGSWFVRVGVPERTQPRLPAVVTLTRIAPKELDDDNLRGALKHCRDQVAECMGLPDDRDPRVRWEYGQRSGKLYGVEVAITEEDSADASP